MQTFKLFFIRCLVTPLTWLPLKWAHNIGGLIGLLLIRYNKKRAHIALSNIKACFPDKSLSEQLALVQQSSIEAGKWLMESPYVWFKNPDYLAGKITIENPELLKQAHDKGKGIVVVLPHQGNWELLNFYIPQRYTFGAMYRPIKSALFEKIIFDGRSRVGSNMFAASPQGVRQALKALKKNHVIAILSDHLPSEEAGVHAPFFGRMALTGKLTQSLARFNDSETLIATVIRKNNAEGFIIRFDTIDGIHAKDPIEAATALNQAIEKSILLAPEQYQWVYRRFAKPPKGEKSIYSDLT